MGVLNIAASGITERIRAMSERPESMPVRNLIERYVGQYTGRDGALLYRLQVWQTLLGEFTLEKLDSDVMHAARSEIAALPALAYKGVDVDGRQIFRSKSRGKVKTPATVNRYMAAISAVFSWAIQERLAPRGWVNPCRGIRRMKGEVQRVRFLDDAELKRLLDACKVSKYPRFYALVLMALLTGARKGELLGLRWRDVDLQAGIARLGRTKNGDRRTLVLLPQVVAALTPFASSDGARYVFGSQRSRHQSPADIGTAWKKALARAEIVDFRFHDLRHCCASYLVQQGIDLSVVADVLGHRKLDMTRRYAHLKTETKADAMRRAFGSIGA